MSARRAPRATRLALAAAAGALLLFGGSGSQSPSSALAPPRQLQQQLLLPVLSRVAGPASASASAASPVPTPAAARPYEDPASFPALRVGLQSVWDVPPAAIIEELWPLQVAAERALRRRLVPADGAEPDLWIVGPYGGRRADVEQLAARTRGRAVSLFIGIENADGSGGRYEEFRDQMLGVTTVSLGFRLDVEAQARAREPALRAAAALGVADPLELPRPYVRFPGWLPLVAERSNASGLALPAALLRRRSRAEAREEAEAWARREGFAAILSSHYAFPRNDMFDEMSKLELGRVEGTGLAFHTMDWPEAELGPNTGHLGGAKRAFLQRFRFSLCPENSRSGDGGYTTEKMPQAHLAGAVPVYWGDEPAEVWSPARIVRFEGRAGGSAEAAAAVRALVENATFRAEWFERPVLRDDAAEWLAAWLRDLEALLADAFGALERARTQAEADRRAAGLA